MKLNFKIIQKNFSLIIIVFILIVAGVSFYLLKPQYDTLKDTQTKMESEKNNLESAKANLENKKSLLKNYDLVKDNLRDLSVALPRAKDIPNLLVQLESLATKNGVLMDSVSYNEVTEETGKAGAGGAAPQVKAAGKTPTMLGEEDPLATPMVEAPKAPETGYSTLKVTLDLSAHYDAFLKYLEDVQQNIRFLDIASISFDIGEGSKGGDSAKSGEGELSFEEKTFDFAVELETYYLK